jgi:hypothetical protein
MLPGNVLVHEEIANPARSVSDRDGDMLDVSGFSGIEGHTMAMISRLFETK